MEQTEHFQLNLPDGEDIYNINDFNENTEKLDDILYEMKETFQGGVEACYNACVTKGSTPASYALGDVVQGILDIPTGGEPYAMFPQEISGRDFYPSGYYELTDYLPLTENNDLVVAHIIPTGDTNITVLFSGDIGTSYTGTVTFSLVIDNTTTIPNIGTVTIDQLDYGERQHFSMSYTLSSSLSSGYHTLALRATFESGFSGGEIYWALCSFYGTGFVAVQNPGYYLINGAFSSYYTPSNFISPINPITYQLLNDLQYCGWPCEELNTAMNAHFSSQFDTGVCFHMEGISGYEQYDPETGDPEVIIPDIEDTLIYSNGKFVYSHSQKRTFPDAHDIVTEAHHFILPIISKFFELYNSIYIHGRMVSRSGDINGSGEIEPFVLKRLNQSTVDLVEYGDYQYLDSLNTDDEFTVCYNFPDIQNNYIQFIGFSLLYLDTGNDPFTIEIDKIWGSNATSEY